MEKAELQHADYVHAEVWAEQERQIEKWGVQNHRSLHPSTISHPDLAYLLYCIPSEELAKKMCDDAFMRGHGNYAIIALEEFCEVIGASTEADRRQELVQLAAVVISWIKCIDRNTPKQVEH